MLLVLITVVVVTTAARIEFLNAEAGQVLPRREFRDDGGRVKWRQAPSNESRWRAILGPRDEEGKPLARELTEAERAQMTGDIRRWKAWNALRDIVSTWGLGQYLLVPAALAIGLSLLLGRRARGSVRLLGGAGVCIAIAAGVLMIHRAYSPSLGW